MAKARKFGWFGGVFTPSILTILGVIMYLRLPTIVGEAGLAATLGIIAVAHLISVATGLSVASIATDKKVEAGGTYYMISRSLGLPIGGTLGLALFVGLSFSVSLYVIGFSESFLGYWGLPVDKNAIRIAGSITLVAVTAVTLVSTSLALRAQFYIMAAIGLSLLSIVVGSHDLGPTSVAVGAATAAPAASFIVLFGIFFPAVTGFEAGVSMSGDLKDPKKAIPVGTMLAIVVGLVVYMALATFLSLTVSADVLRDDPGVFLKIARVPALVVAGIWGATISSALGSILGAPRILQATAVDRIAPRVFAAGFGPSNEPRNALLVTFVLAEIGILVGELDVIARVVSMFFITTYGFLNLSCAIERWASPDFRPDFKVPSWVSLIGAVACFVVMIQLDFVAMLAATAALGSLYLVLARRQLTLASGDTWEGVWASVSRVALSRLVKRDVHKRNWRPNILVFAGPDGDHGQIRRLGEWLAYTRGMASIVEIEGSSNGPAGRPVPVPSPEDRVGFFTHRISYGDRYEGMLDVARLHGFGGVEPNTVLLGWPRDASGPGKYHETIDAIAKLDLNLLVLDYDREREYGAFSTIDVWLQETGRNAGLALALVRFLTTADPWGKATVRLLKWYEGDSAFTGAVRDALAALLGDIRLNASIHVIQAAPGENFSTAVRRESGGTDLTILGIPQDGRLSSEHFVRQTNQIIESLGTVLLLRASTAFEDRSVGDFLNQAQLLDAGGPIPDDVPDPAALVERGGAFKNEVRRVDAAVREAFGHLQHEIAVAEGLSAPLLSDTSDLVRGARTNLERGVQAADRPRRSRAVDREVARVLYRSREILESARGEPLQSQARTLASGVGLAARTLEHLESSIPVRMGGKESFPRKPVRVRTRYERSALPALLADIESAVQDFDRRAQARIDAAIRLQSALADALDRVSEAVASGDAPDEVVDAEFEALASLEAELLEELDEVRGEHSAALLAAGPEVLSSWVGEMMGVAPPGFRLPTVPGSVAKNTLSRLRNVGPAWTSHQGLRLASAELQARLWGARHRMEVVLDRALGDVRLETDITLKGVEALTSHLEARAARDEDVGPFPEVHAPLAGQTVLERIADELREAIGELPEEWHAPEPGSDSDPLEERPVRRFNPHESVDHRLRVTLLTPLEPSLLALGAACERAVEVGRDVTRLVRFASTDDPQAAPEERSDSLEAVLENGMERLGDARVAVTEALERVLDTASSGLHAVEPHLIASAVAASADDGSGARGDRFDLARALEDGLRALRREIARPLAGIWYRRSRGVILGERLRLGEAEWTPVERILTLVEAASPDPEILRRLPFYYRQLFLEHAVTTRDFWVPRPRAEAQLAKASDRFRAGVQGGVLIVGEPGSGKSSLVGRFVQKGGGEAVRILPSREATSDVHVFREHLRRSLGTAGDPEDALGRLPSGALVVVEDLELWCERRSGGMAVVEYVMGLIDDLGGRCFFVVTTTPLAQSLFRRVVSFESRFLASVRLDPFSALELRDAVLIRHRSTGMGLEVDGRPTGRLSDWRVARYFNRLFDRTHGNVGDALQSWVASVHEVEGDEVHVRTLEAPRAAVSRELTSRQRALLAAILFHRRVSAHSLAAMTGLDPSPLAEELGVLRRSGLVDESGGIWSPNRFVEGDVRREFQSEGVL